MSQRFKSRFFRNSNQINRVSAYTDYGHERECNAILTWKY